MQIYHLASFHSYYQPCKDSMNYLACFPGCLILSRYLYFLLKINTVAFDFLQMHYLIDSECAKENKISVCKFRTSTTMIVISNNAIAKGAV